VIDRVTCETQETGRRRETYSQPWGFQKKKRRTIKENQEQQNDRTIGFRESSKTVIQKERKKERKKEKGKREKEIQHKRIGQEINSPRSLSRLLLAIITEK